MFQDLVWDICRKILGEGAEKFAKGRDGGRDVRFTGKANRFPSEIQPLDGKFIVQVKWTQEESATFSDTAFQGLLLNEEAPKAKKLKEADELNHWLIFGNRRRPAGSSTTLEKNLLTAVGCESVYLRGSEELDGWLAHEPEIVRRYDLEGLLIPFRIEPLELREVIEALYSNKSEAMARASARWDFAGYAGIEKKNQINKLTPRYFKTAIRSNSEPHFSAIKAFLENPRNRELADRYHEAAAEIQEKAMAFRERFDTFDKIVEVVGDELYLTSPQFQKVGKSAC